MGKIRSSDRKTAYTEVNCNFKIDKFFLVCWLHLSSYWKAKSRILNSTDSSVTHKSTYAYTNLSITTTHNMSNTS